MAFLNEALHCKAWQKFLKEIRSPCGHIRRWWMMVLDAMVSEESEIMDVQIRLALLPFMRWKSSTFLQLFNEVMHYRRNMQIHWSLSLRNTFVDKVETVINLCSSEIHPLCRLFLYEITMKDTRNTRKIRQTSAKARINTKKPTKLHRNLNIKKWNEERQNKNKRDDIYCFIQDCLQEIVVKAKANVSFMVVL